MSGLERFAEMEFQGGGSQSETMQMLILCATVVGEITRDEQLLGIADGLTQMAGGSGPQPPADGRQLQGPQQQPAPRGGLIGAG